MNSTKLRIENNQGYKLNAFLELPANQKPNYYAVLLIALRVVVV